MFNFHRLEMMGSEIQNEVKAHYSRFSLRNVVLERRREGVKTWPSIT